MSTKAPQMLVDYAHRWENMFASAVFAGIVGDINHPDGYHISYNDNPPGNYSIVRPPDKPPKLPDANRPMASAVDMSMNKSDMVTCHNRILAVYNDHSDPRRKYFNAVNCWDGKSADAVRLDLYSNTKSYASPDHKSHVHDETTRMYCQDPMTAQAKLSVWSGQSKDDWMNDVGQVEGFTKDGFKDMMKTDDAIPNLPWRNDFLQFDAPDGATGPNGGTNRFIMWETWFDGIGHYLFDNEQRAQKAREDFQKQLDDIKAMIEAGPVPQPVKGTLQGPVVFTPEP